MARHCRCAQVDPASLDIAGSSCSTGRKAVNVVQAGCPWATSCREDVLLFRREFFEPCKVADARFSIYYLSSANLPDLYTVSSIMSRSDLLSSLRIMAAT